MSLFSTSATDRKVGKAEKKAGKPEDLLCSRLEDEPSATGLLPSGSMGINTHLLRLPDSGREGVFLFPSPPPRIKRPN
jgi:hypothetical protein